jgi:HNH endonuclease
MNTARIPRGKQPPSPRRQAQAARLREFGRDPAWRAYVTARRWAGNARERQSEFLRARWREDAAFRDRSIAASRARWRDPILREKLLAGRRRRTVDDMLTRYVRPEPAPDGCWRWIGPQGGGFGICKLHSFTPRIQKAHRVVFEHVTGQNPRGAVLRHRCGVKLCVRPNHLECVSPVRCSVERMMAQYVRKDPSPNGCWQWAGSRGESGYGRIHARNGGGWAHRVVFERVVGPIPIGMQLHHLCRVRTCVRPEHLQVVNPEWHGCESNQVRWSRVAEGDKDDDATSSAHPVEVADDPDWLCECGATNAAGRLCEMCGAAA